MNKTGLKIIREFPEWPNEPSRINNWNGQFIDSNVIINARSSNEYFPKHWTPLSIKCAFGGSEFYVTDKLKFRVDDKSFLVLNNGQMYESFIRADRSVNSFTICFAPDFAEKVFNSITGSTNELLNDPFRVKDGSVNFSEQLYRFDRQFQSLLHSLKHNLENSIYDIGLINEQLHLILFRLYFLHTTVVNKVNSLPKVRPATRLEIYKRLVAARDYIESNYSDKVELSDIASTVNMCEHHLLREFRKEFRITPHQYLTNKRLEQSKELLAGSELSVSQIAIDSGFEFLSSFTRLFTKRFGISPTSFRSKNSIQKVNFG